MKNDITKATINADLDASSGEANVHIYGTGDELLFLCGVIIRDIAMSMSKEENEPFEGTLFKALSMATFAATNNTGEDAVTDPSEVASKN